LPGVTDQIVVTRVGCFITIDGKELMNGTCHHRLTNTTQVFMTLPESATQITVMVGRLPRFRGIKLWSKTADGKQHEEYLGIWPKRQEDGCHTNDRVRICWWSLVTPPPPTPLSPVQQQLDQQINPRCLDLQHPRQGLDIVFERTKSARSDLVPCIRVARQTFPDKAFVIAAPPTLQIHADLRSEANAHFAIKKSQIQKALFGRAIWQDGAVVARRPIAIFAAMRRASSIVSTFAVSACAFVSRA
jgi:hypothetical protein